MHTTRSRILIADDHTLMAECCKKLLGRKYEVIGTVGDGRAMVRAAAELKPDLIIVDVAMPMLNGLDAGKQIKELIPSIKLLFLSMYEDAELAAEAFRRGASGYLPKTCAPSDLVSAVRKVLKGASYLSPTLGKDAVALLSRQRGSDDSNRLTVRQREVLQLLAEGRSAPEIARLLHLKTRTVFFHKNQIKELVKLKSTAELVQYAIRHHLIAA